MKEKKAEKGIAKTNLNIFPSNFSAPMFPNRSLGQNTGEELRCS